MKPPARWPLVAWSSRERDCAGRSGAIQRPGPGDKGVALLAAGTRTSALQSGEAWRGVERPAGVGGNLGAREYVKP